MEYFDIFMIFLVSFLVLSYIFRAKGGLPTNWPVIGMLFPLLTNANKVHELVIDILAKSHELAFHFKGPWLTNMSFLVTANQANIHHIFSKNFGNYSKGPNFHEIFEGLGDGIFNAESTIWQYHRNMAHSFFGHPKFQPLLINTLWDEMKSRLIPLLDHFSNNDIEFDLLDVFKRFTFDNICTILMSQNPNFLSIDLPPRPFSKAVEEIEALMFKRHVLPTFVWKSLLWLGVGCESKYKKNIETVDHFLYKWIAKTRAQRSSNGPTKEVDEVSHDLLTSYMVEQENGRTPINTKGDVFLRDSILCFILAGAQTTSVAFAWFFYLLTNYPQVTTKIREEINNILTQNNETFDGFLNNFNEYNNKLVYLHAAISESLRLYPPVAFNHKASIKSDTLPSGHKLEPDMNIIFDMYAMGRMKSIWGDDCEEFKPERWITERGNIKIEPSFKFLVFGAGPRVCQGKDMALTQLKFVIASMIHTYDIEALQGQQVVPEISVILNMKHGFKVKIKRHQH